jgi:hypothetical protein
LRVIWLTFVGCGIYSHWPSFPSAGLRTINALDGQLDLAILDVDLAGERSELIAEELLRRGILFMFATAHDRQRTARSKRSPPMLNISGWHRKPWALLN